MYIKQNVSGLLAEATLPLRVIKKSCSLILSAFGLLLRSRQAVCKAGKHSA
jgi:hypothetical protein